MAEEEGVSEVEIEKDAQSEVFGSYEIPVEVGEEEEEDDDDDDEEREIVQDEKPDESKKVATTRKLSQKEIEDLFDKNTSSFRCLAQVLISRSSLLRHILYPFPPLKDPGIDEVFNYVEPEPVYDDIGTEKYKNMCSDLAIVPIKRVLKSLSTNLLNLKFYGLSYKQIKAICTTMMLNNHVEELILRDNWISPEGCYYVGEMLRENNSVKILDLRECRIGIKGLVNMVEGLNLNQSLVELDLSYNSLGDDGLQVLIEAIAETQLIEKLNLGHNLLSDKGAKILGEFMVDNWSVEHLDLAWNNLYSVTALKELFNGLTDNIYLKYLNLSWNGICTIESTIQIVKYIKNTNVLEHLDLSNNRLMGDMVKAIKGSLTKNTSLRSVNLSYNLITPEDANSLINVFKANPESHLQYMDLENVFVDKSFVPTWQKLTKEGKHIRIQGILNDYKISEPNVKKVLFNRIRFLGQKPKSKKAKRDFGHFIYTMPEGVLERKELHKLLKKFKIKVDADLVSGLAAAFKKGDKVDLDAMKICYLKMYPDSEPPPPPKEKKKKGGKGKRDSKSKEDQEVQTDTTLSAREEFNIDANRASFAQRLEEASVGRKSTQSDGVPKEELLHDENSRKTSQISESMQGGKSKSVEPNEADTDPKDSIVPENVPIARKSIMDDGTRRSRISKRATIVSLVEKKSF